MTNELTDVRCSCGDEYPADSYDAGFIAGSGMCQNCDAALPPKDICTCPSGDSSLRHPCPAHPASVDLAGVAAKLTFINGRPAMCGCQVEYSSGGGEYSDVIDVTLCAKHSGSAILDLVATNRIALTPEYEGQWHADLYLDREIPLAKAEGATPAEAVLALMSAERIDPEQESVGQAGGDERAAFFKHLIGRHPAHETEIVRVVEHNYAAWKAWQARAALAQPSQSQYEASFEEWLANELEGEDGQPVPAAVCDITLARRAFNHWPKLEQPAKVGGVRFSAGVSSRLVVEAAQRLYEFESTPEKEAERPEVVAYADPVAFARFKERGHEGGVAGREWMWAEPTPGLVAMSRTDECERIVGALRFERQQMDRAFTACINERDAALAGVAELERQEPVATVAKVPGEDWNSLDFHRDLQDMQPGTKLYAAPVAQAQQLNDLDKQCRDDVARALGLRPNQERGFAWSYLLASIKSCVKASGDSAQAQHSGAEGWRIERSAERIVVMNLNNGAGYAAARDGESGIAESVLYLLAADLLAAAPGKEVPQAWLDVQAERRRQITAEGWTPEHDDEHSHGQMARAAACYALAGSSAPNDGTAALLVSLAWPWDEQWWKPSTARRDMVKACALGLAEIERLDRAAPGKEGV